MAEKRDYLETAVERMPLCADGRVGSSIERVVLPDGRRFVVKRVIPMDNLRLSMTGDHLGREYLAWSRGILDALPPVVSHAIVDGWLDGDSAVVVMRDLSSSLLGGAQGLSRSDCRTVLAGLGAMHRSFLGDDPGGLTPLPLHLSLFAPGRMRMYAGGPDALPDAVLQGWEAFDDLVHEDISAAVFGLLDDAEPLARALLARPCTLIHGDPAAANIAIAGGRLTLVDWGYLATAPAALDIARLLAGSGPVLEMSREEAIADYERSAGPAFDVVALRLALLSALLLLGWRKALDITRHSDEEVRQREWEDLEWWIAHARRTLEAALL
jgi:hypothetical protein